MNDMFFVDNIFLCEDFDEKKKVVGGENIWYKSDSYLYLAKRQNDSVTSLNTEVGP